LRRQWVSRVLEEKAQNPNREVKAPTHQVVLQWVAKACASISPQTIVRGWHRAGFDYLVPDVREDGDQGYEDDPLSVPEIPVEFLADALNSLQIVSGEDSEHTD